MPAPALLYLDTARLGQMSEMAQRLSTAFIRLSAEEPFSLYFENFMRTGFAGWPESYQQRFPDLSPWGGVESVRNGIRHIAGASRDAPVVLASRSLWLVRSAARTAFKICRRILTTDLSWPSYEEVLCNEATRTGYSLHCVAIRRRILDGTLSEGELIDAIVVAFHKNHCDGIFLPAVDNLGVRLPIEKVVLAIESRSELRFVLTDAAQALGHVPLDGVCRVSDCLIAGCHKWVRAYHPLGIGIVGRERHASKLRRDLASQRTGDPLFGFLDSLESDRLSGHLETVNLTPLFSCQGAIQGPEGLDAAAFAQRLRNGELVRDFAAQLGWNPIVVDKPMLSGIQLLDIPHHMMSHDVERALHDGGVRATVYETRLLRLSLPAKTLAPHELQRLGTALPDRGKCDCKSGGPLKQALVEG